MAVVDDDAISRSGMVGLLDAEPRTRVVLACSHQEAAAAFTVAERIDVLVVDAADDRDHADDFPGVGVVAALRGGRHRDAMAIVVTAHFLEGGLSLRMREVGADLLVNRRDLREGQALVDLVLDPAAARRPTEVADQEQLHALGITPSSRLQALVSEVERGRLAGLLDDARAPEGAPASRAREWMRIRERIAGAGRISPRNVDGTAPRRDQAVPSLAQLRRVYRYAVRTKDRRPPD